MKLRNKNTGEIRKAEAREDGIYLWDELTEHWWKYELDLLASGWEYYVEPAEPIFDDEKVSKAIRAWLSIQVQPIEAVSILCNKDNDGFFCYRLYGYIAKARIVDGKAVVNNNLTAIGFDFRSDVYFEHKRGQDYTITELCGEEEE